jgi:hypothetical protein
MNKKGVAGKIPNAPKFTAPANKKIKLITNKKTCTHSPKYNLSKFRRIPNLSQRFPPKMS